MTVRLREIEELYKKDPEIQDVRVELTSPTTVSLPAPDILIYRLDLLLGRIRYKIKHLELPCIFGFEPWCQPEAPPTRPPPERPPTPPPEQPPTGPPPPPPPEQPPTPPPQEECRTTYRDPRISFRAGITEVRNVRASPAPYCIARFTFLNRSQPGQVCQQCPSGTDCNPIAESAFVHPRAWGTLYIARDAFGGQLDRDVALFDFAAPFTRRDGTPIYIRPATYGYWDYAVTRLASDRALTYLRTAAYYGRALTRQVFNITVNWRWRGRMRQATVRIDYRREVPFRR